MRDVTSLLYMFRNMELLRFNSVQIAILLLYLVKVVINPYQLEDVSDEIVSNFYNSVFSPFYGHQAEPDGQTSDISYGQRNITVFLYDEAFLDQSYTKEWPIPPNNYRPTFLTLAEAGAAMVFVDIYFQGGGEEKQQQIANLFSFAKGLEQRTGMPIVFSGVLDNPLPTFNDVSAPHSALVEAYTSNSSYAFVESTEEGTLPTAAFKLYNEWCRSHICENKIENVSVDDQMFVLWGSGPDAQIRKYYEDRYGQSQTNTQCDIYSARSSRKITDALRILMSRVFTMNRDIANPASCMYSRNFSISELEGFTSEEFEEFVQGKIILIGGAIDEFPDYTYSPVNLYVPGIFAISMALDNMLEAGDDYYRWVTDDLASIFVEAIVAITLVLSYLYFKSLTQGLKPEHLQDRLTALFGLTALLYLMVIVMTSMHVFKWAPNNWLSYLLLFLFVSVDSIKAIIKLFIPYMRFHGLKHKILNRTIQVTSLILYLVVVFLSSIFLVFGPILLLFSNRDASIIWYSLFCLVYISLIALSINKIFQKAGNNYKQLKLHL